MRLQDAPVTQSRVALQNPLETAIYLRQAIPGSIRYSQEVENLIVLSLSTRRFPIGVEVITQGTLASLLIEPREVFRGPVVIGAAAIILCHNHPSGDPAPSEADIKVTRDLIRAGQLMKIEVLDHIVLGTPNPEEPQRYSSLRELGFFSF